MNERFKPYQVGTGHRQLKHAATFGDRRTKRQRTRGQRRCRLRLEWGTER